MLTSNNTISFQSGYKFPELNFPDLEAELSVVMDAFSYGISAMLQQRTTDEWLPIFLYRVTYLQTRTVGNVIRTIRQFLEELSFHVLTDHNL